MPKGEGKGLKFLHLGYAWFELANFADSMESGSDDGALTDKALRSLVPLLNRKAERYFKKAKELGA